MTKAEFDSLKIGDKIRRHNEYDILTLIKIIIEETHNEEDIIIVGQTIKGDIKTGKYRNFVVPKKFVKVNKLNGNKETVTLFEISNQVGLYSYYHVSKPIDELLLDGINLYTSNYIFRYE